MELIGSWILIIVIICIGCFSFWIGIDDSDGVAIFFAICFFALAAFIGFMWTEGLYTRYRQQKEVEKVYNIHITEFSGDHWGTDHTDEVKWKIPEGDKIKSCSGTLKHFPQGWRFVKGKSSCEFESTLIDSPENNVYRKVAG